MRSRRITFTRPVHVRPLDRPGPMRRLFAANLSEGGMFIRSPQPLPEGERVEVFLEARGQVLRFAEAVVAFTLPREQAASRGRLPGSGLQFTQLPPSSKALVKELLRMFPERRAVTRLPRARVQGARAAAVSGPELAAAGNTRRSAAGALMLVAFAAVMAAIALSHLHPLF